MITNDQLVYDTDPMIREISQDVPLPLSDEDRQLGLDMLEYLKMSQDEELSEKYDIRPGVGLAAVQVGQLKRMCAIYIPDEPDEDGNVDHIDQWVLVNPKIIGYTPKVSYLRNGEGCLSVPEDRKGIVPRHAKVTLTGYDILTDSDVRIVARGFTAICLQHELDHFDGVLYYDHFNQEDPNRPIPGAMVIE